jgi:predicted alpha/beta-fold hydrolase
VRRATTLRAFDSLTVVPRYGFRDVDHYYQSQSASNALPHIARPTLIVSARHDPMIPWRLADDMRRQMSRAVTFRWAESGGHVFFPADLMLGERASRGLGPQLIAWLERQG